MNSEEASPGCWPFYMLDQTINANGELKLLVVREEDLFCHCCEWQVERLGVPVRVERCTKGANGMRLKRQPRFLEHRAKTY